MAFTTLALDALLLLIALANVVYGLDNAGSQMTKQGLQADIWLTRLVVQNGTALYLSWSICAALVGGVIEAVYAIGLDMATSCLIALVILMTIVIVWFTLETFAFDRQLRYVFAHYIPLVAACAGNYTLHFDPAVGYTVFDAALLVFVAVLALTKLIIMVIKGLLDPITYPTT